MKILIGDYKQSLEGGQTYQENLVNNIDPEKITFGILTRDKNLSSNERFSQLTDRIHVIPLRIQPLKLIKSFKELKHLGYTHIYLNRAVLSIPEMLACLFSGMHLFIHGHSSKAEAKSLHRRIILTFDHLFSRFFILPLIKRTRLACSYSASQWFFGKSAYKNSKVFIIKNAIDTEKFIFNLNSRNAERKKISLEETTLIIGTVGRFVYVKNQTFLIDIFNEILKKVPNAILFIVGKGALEQEYRNKIEHLGIRENVKIISPREDIENLYFTFDIFVLPSHFEGLPLTLVEAQASSLRCFSSDTVTKESDITGLIDFLSLSDGAEKWADAILSAYPYERTNRSDEITAAGYNIKNQIKEVENILLSAKE